jgi:hypothetical protein
VLDQGYVLPAINGSELCGGETISSATGPAALSRDHHRQLGDQQVRREHRPDPRCLALEVAVAELVTEHSAQRVHGRAGDAGAERSTAALGEQLLGDVQHERRSRAP